jgi:hypothetical protein
MITPNSLNQEEMRMQVSYSIVNDSCYEHTNIFEVLFTFWCGIEVLVLSKKIQSDQVVETHV